MALTGGGAIEPGDQGSATPAAGNITEIYLSFPNAFDAQWVDGTSYSTSGTLRDTNSPNDGIEFQGDVTLLDPPLLASEQGLVHSGCWPASGRNDISLAIPNVEPGTYRVDFYGAQYNEPPLASRDFTVRFQNGQAAIYVSFSGTNAAQVASASVTIADEGSGSGTLVVELNPINDNPVVSALRMVPESPQGNQAPATPVITASALNFHEIKLQFSVASDDVAVISRELRRNGSLIATLPANQILYVDSQLNRGEQYSYTLTDIDAEPLSSVSDAVSVYTLGTHRIDCGQTVDYQAFDGAVWYADTAYTGSPTLRGSVTTNPITNTPDPLLYQSATVEASSGAGFGYSFPLDTGTWRAVFCFAEYQSGTAIGDRLFDIAIDGVTVESSLDVYAEAGLENALKKDYIFVSDNQFDCTFTGVAGTAFVSAIEVIPALDTPTSLLASSITSTSFTVQCSAVLGAVSYRWYIDGELAIPGSTTATSDFSGLSPSTAYDITVEAIDDLGYATLQSAVLEVTTLAAPAPPSYQLLSTEDWSEYLSLIPYGADPETAGTYPMQMYQSFTGRDDLTRFSIVRETAGDKEREDITLYTSWVCDLYTTDLTTPDVTLDSASNPEYFDLTDPDAVGIYFGKHTGPIAAGIYTGALYARDANHPNGKTVREAFKLEHTDRG